MKEWLIEKKNIWPSLALVSGLIESLPDTGMSVPILTAISLEVSRYGIVDLAQRASMLRSQLLEGISNSASNGKERKRLL